MRHEKSLGDIVGGFPKRESTPPPPAPRVAALVERARTPGDIIIRYERVYEAANHSRVHISNGSTPRYSV